jgi:hypothetical protein
MRCKLSITHLEITPSGRQISKDFVNTYEIPSQKTPTMERAEINFLVAFANKRRIPTFGYEYKRFIEKYRPLIKKEIEKEWHPVVKEPEPTLFDQKLRKLLGSI